MIVFFIFLILADPSYEQQPNTILSEIEAIADAADHDGYGGNQALEETYESTSSQQASYKSTTGGYQSVEVVYESTPEQQLSYQESTYQAPTSEETTYQDTPPQPIYQQSTEYSEEPTSSESYYAKIRESQSNNEDNELIQEIEALERKLDVLQEEIQNYLNE